MMLEKIMDKLFAVVVLFFLSAAIQAATCSPEMAKQEPVSEKVWVVTHTIATAAEFRKYRTIFVFQDGDGPGEVRWVESDEPEQVVVGDLFFNKREVREGKTYYFPMVMSWKTCTVWQVDSPTTDPFELEG